MATIIRTLSKKINDNGKAEILLRVTLARGKQFRVKSGAYIRPDRFDNGKFKYPRANQKEAAEIRTAEAELTRTEQFILDLCQKQGGDLDKETFAAAFEKYRRPVAGSAPLSFRDLTKRYAEAKGISRTRNVAYGCLTKNAERFDQYRIKRGRRPAFESPAETTPDDLSEFAKFMADEGEAFDLFPGIFPLRKSGPQAGQRRRPKPRSKNTIEEYLRAMRAVYKFACAGGLIPNVPFTRFKIDAPVYGTPYYITLGERDIIADWDFSKDPELEAARDIFIFQCFVGCRVSDLRRLTLANVINGGIEYVPRKTSAERAEVVRVPLHPRAAEIVAKYNDRGVDGSLLPVTYTGKYNTYIRRIFTICGITRPVTVWDSTTGAEESRPLNEIATSHMARRTFIGNLYKQVKDPNLIGKLSGHVEGSSAFARYRDIDEDLRKEMINLLSAGKDGRRER